MKNNKTLAFIDSKNRDGLIFLAKNIEYYRQDISSLWNLASQLGCSNELLSEEIWEHFSEKAWDALDLIEMENERQAYRTELLEYQKHTECLDPNFLKKEEREELLQAAETCYTCIVDMVFGGIFEIDEVSEFQCTKESCFPFLLECFPEFQKQWVAHLKFWENQERTIEIDCVEFASFVLNLCEQKETDLLLDIFQVIEALLFTSDSELFQALHHGFLDMVVAEPMLHQYLGAKSQKLCGIEKTFSPLPVQALLHPRKYQFLIKLLIQWLQKNSQTFPSDAICVQKNIAYFQKVLPVADLNTILDRAKCFEEYKTRYEFIRASNT